MTTLAGSPGLTAFLSADGTGNQARFHSPYGLAVDGVGNLYVADYWNDTIRKVTAAGVVTTLAGTAGQSGSADGTGSAARFNGPTGVAVDSVGNVYVADTGNNLLRKVTATGVVTTLAGSPGQSGTADGTGSAARFGGPGGGIGVDLAGNIYLTDNYTIRKVTPAGVVTTLVGTPDSGGSADGRGAAARFFVPEGLAVGNSGNLYVADTGNATIRVVTSDGTVTTLAGSPGLRGSIDGVGAAARFGGGLDSEGPEGIALDANGNLFVADPANDTIRKVTMSGVVTTMAGEAEHAGATDGVGNSARFSYPYGLAVDSTGNAYVADWVNDTIRKVTPAGVVTTVAGSAGQFGSADGIGTAARLMNPGGVAVGPAGQIYFTDTANNTLRVITATGAVTTLAGRPGSKGSADGAGNAATFNHPIGVAVDSAGNIYVADTLNAIVRAVTPAGAVTTLAGVPGALGMADGTGAAAQFGWPFGVAVDSTGNLYVTDEVYHTLRKIGPGGGVTTLAGKPGLAGSQDGVGGDARFYSPTGVTIDGAGNLYVTDWGNHTLRHVTPTGVVTTIAGTPGGLGGADGLGPTASFGDTFALAIDRVGNLYVADAGNNCITKGIPVPTFTAFQTHPDGAAATLDGLLGGATILVQSSVDLQNWTVVSTNTAGPFPSTLQVNAPLTPAAPFHFLRALSR
ncbi:MAG: hypothetical protein KGS61_07620 [Verrucomicrobia bacterium]|nr:hypothetical protein [Verrucomicrobiota bacterium]